MAGRDKCVEDMQSVGAGVRDAPLEADDALFWQFPCITEGAAWQTHRLQPFCRMDASGEAHAYVGLPWATWIDLRHKRAQTLLQDVQISHQLALTGARIRRVRQRLQAQGIHRLRVHTVCQHIFWADWLDEWSRMGITDLWLSHCPNLTSLGQSTGVALHPWSLYAVNVETPGRTRGLRLGMNPGEKRYLASFIGAHMPHYLSDVRLKLDALKHTPGFLVEVGNVWHFEREVYQSQMDGIKPQVETVAAEMAAVEAYNRVLSDSVFALCPAGAGPNTLRFWEALAVGAIPVLLGRLPVLPAGGTLSDIDWSAIAITVEDQDISSLPTLLANISLAERERRQRLGMQAYAKVKMQRCF